MDKKGIHHGDFVVVKKRNTAANGEIVVALIDGDATLKELQRIEGGRRLNLIPHSHNPDHETMTFDADRVSIQGILSGVVRTNPV